MKKAFQTRHVISGICLLYIICSAVIFAGVASFSVFAGDDYTITYHAATGSGVFAHLANGFRFLAREYFEWQGTYFYSVLYGSLNPLDGAGLPQLRFFMALNAFLFLVSVLFLVYASVRVCKKQSLTAFLACGAGVLFGLLNASYYTEAFTWFTGTIDFSTPLTVGFFGFGCYLLQFHSVKKRTAVVSAVCVFLAAGGSLSLAGTMCYAMLLVLLYRKLTDGVWHKRGSVIWLVSFAGALINTIAPGNYARHSVVDSSLRPVGAAVKSIARFILRTDYLLSDTVFGLAMLVAVLIGFCMFWNSDAGKVSSVRLLTAAAGLLAPCVALFPLYLGAGYSAAWLPDRIDFVTDTAMVLASFHLFVLAGACLADAAKGTDRRLVPAALGLLLFSGVCTNSLNAYDLPQYGTAKALASGELREYHDACASVYETLENAPGKDVVVELPAPVAYLSPLDHLDDPQEWKNMCMSEYYGCKSFKGTIPGE